MNFAKVGFDICGAEPSYFSTRASANSSERSYLMSNGMTDNHEWTSKLCRGILQGTTTKAVSI
jgi:hypothetical protein